MLWVNFLHIYQPANVDGRIIDEATDASYYRLIRALEENKKIKFTFNISGCLVLRWENQKYFDLIKRIKKLVQAGKIELVGSVAYHPLMPLIPIKEAERQIRENEDILKYFFGQKIKLKGFFFPEMAYSPQVGKLVKKMGYQWTILDEIAYNGKLNQVDFDKVYQDKETSLDIVFRSRRNSSCYVPELLFKKIKQKSEKNKLFITATDGELYGLRHIDHTAVFEKLLKNPLLKTDTISNFISKHKERECIKLLTCSWNTTEKEIKKGEPFNLWKNPKNKIQIELWNFANLAYKLMEKHKNDQNYNWARWHFVRGLASCTFWWASSQDFRSLFGPISWNPDEIERGINEFIRSIRSLADSTTHRTKMNAEKKYIKLKKMIWEKHWEYYRKK